MLEDLRALVEFAHAGSIAGAADRLFRTPSAVTRQVQRLEAALGAELLDRSVKPPRLNSLGSRVLEQARDLLQRTEALKSLTSSDAEPHPSIAIVLVAQVGALGKAVELLEHGCRQLFAAADTTNPVARQRRRVRASRQAARLPK
jgi:DNA-binding transcriptional LysR family regulator